MERKFAINICVIALLLCVGFYLMPSISDDLGYALPFRDYLIGDGSFDWRKIWESIVYRYNEDNARLCNVVAILLSPLPRIIAICGSFASLVYLLAVGAKYAKVQSNSMLVAAWLAYVVFVFPWIDQMYLIDFQINYLWSSALSLLLSIMFLKQRRYKLWQLMAISIVLGLWHEGFAFPLTVMMAAVFVTCKQMRTAKTVAMVAALAIGQIYLFTAPSFSGEANRYFGTRLMMFMPYLLPTLAMIFCLKFRRVKISARVAVLVGPTLVSAAMMVFTESGARVGSLSIVFAGLCLLLMVNKTKDKKWCAGIVLALAALHLVAVDVQAYKAHVDTKRVLQEYKEHRGEAIYSDMTLRENAPWYCLQKPYYGWFSHDCTLKVIESFYGDGTHQLKVVPSALKAFDAAEAEKIEGTANAWYYEGLIVLQVPLTRRCVGTFEMNYGEGAKWYRMMLMPFVSQKDGKPYVWAYAEQTNVEQMTAKPTLFNIE